jgi:hypothetical protein
MTFPVIENVQTYTSGTTSVSTLTLNWPTGLVAGEAVVVIATPSASGYVSNTGGFTQLNGGTERILVLSKTASGSESGTFDVVIGSAGRNNAAVFRISGVASVAVSAGANSVDPGSVTLAEEDDWLFLTAVRSERCDNGWTQAPTGYGIYPDEDRTFGILENNSGSTVTSNKTLCWASRTNNQGASEDPDAWTYTGTIGTQGSTVVALQGAASGVQINSTTKLDDGQEFTISGVGFAGEGSVRICPTDDIDDIGGVVQTITSWSATTIVVAAADLSGLTPGQQVFVFVTNDADGANAEGYAVSIADMVVRVASASATDDAIDTDLGTAIASESVEVLVHGGATADRTLLYNVDGVFISGGLLEFPAPGVATIETEDDQFLVSVYSSSDPTARSGAYIGFVVDRNED